MSLIRDTLIAHPSELMSIKGAKAGDFTLFHWYKVFFDGKNSKNLFYSPFWNTVKVSIGSCVIAIGLGGTVAWLVARSDIRFKSIISTIFVFPYIMPSWTLAMAWLNFFRNAYIGGKPGLFTALTGIETANWFAYGQFPIIVVTGLHYAPFAYILIGGILQNMDCLLYTSWAWTVGTFWRLPWKSVRKPSTFRRTSGRPIFHYSEHFPGLTRWRSAMKI